MAKVEWTRTPKGYTSKCGRFRLERTEVCTSRNGYYRTEWLLFGLLESGEPDQFERVTDAKKWAQLAADEA